jgi:protein gp37
MQPGWVVDIRDQCLAADIPFFFKQWGGVNKKKNGRMLENEIWDETPSHPQWRETSRVRTGSTRGRRTVYA